MTELKLTQKRDSLGEWRTYTNYRCMWCGKRRYLNGLLLCRECWKQVKNSIAKEVYEQGKKEGEGIGYGIGLKHGRKQTLEEVLKKLKKTKKMIETYIKPLSEYERGRYEHAWNMILELEQKLWELSK